MKPEKKFSRRKFLSLLGCSGAAGIGYVRFLEPGWLQVGRHDVTIHPEQPPVRILHLSDFHASPVVSLEQIADAVKLGLSLQPDLVCLTGDFITRKYQHFPEYSRVLKALSDAVPTLACLGNHDGGRWAARHGYADTSLVSAMLKDANVRLLHNASTEIQIKGRNLVLVGVGDLWARDLQPEWAFTGIRKTPASTIVLLSHNPDTKSDVRPYPWDLLLCGHTHGGQLVLPLVGRPFLPIQDKRFAEGLHVWENRWIHVTRGVGNLHGVRLNCPPEVSLLTIT